MLASVTLPAGNGHAGPEVTIAASGGGDLVGEARLAGGVVLAVDLATPHRWQRVSVERWDERVAPVLLAVLGADALAQVATLRSSVTELRPRIELDISPDLAAAGPWLRLAAVDGLDRWLQLPLDQALVDAERGVVRGEAALLLPDGDARHGLLGEALDLARSSADGVADFLGRLGRVSSPVPSGLWAAIERVVEGYERLLRDVEGQDERLRRVVDGWRRPVLQEATLATTPGEVGSRTVRPGGGLPLDPRRLRARVVDLDAGASASSTRLAGEDAVLVEVPAFAGLRPTSPEADHLLARLVDRRSGRERATATLALADPAPRRVFRGIVPLRGAAMDDVQVDVYDIDLAPGASEPVEDAASRRVRRAALFLREWRRLAAEAVLPQAVVQPARRLTSLARALTAGLPGPDHPAFIGGPTAAELLRLAQTEEAALRRALRSPAATPTWQSTTQGPGAPLVAELAAAHTTS